MRLTDEFMVERLFNAAPGSGGDGRTFPWPFGKLLLDRCCKSRESLRLYRSLNQYFQQSVGVCLDRFTNFNKLYDINTPFAPLVFGDEGLLPMKTFSELILS